jgi:integrase
MKRRLPNNLTSFVDRHGKERFRFRKTGRPTYYFKGHPGTERHPSEEYKELVSGKPVTASRATPGTIDDLLQRFYGSSSWEGIGADTRRVRRGILEAFREQHGAKRVAKVTFEHIEAILVAKAKKRVDVESRRMVGGKEASRSLKKQLTRLFTFAVKLGMIETNPVSLADGVKVPKTGGFHTWTEDEIATYQAKHALGTKARLALEIILWTGQRRGDVHRFGRAHLKAGKIRYTQAKTGKELWLPAAPQLLEAIAAMPVVGAETFLVTDYGKSFSRSGFGNKMREWCDEAGLPQCSAHGLRKAIARRLAEDGAGNQGIKSVGGWSGDAEVSTYTAEVDQRALAETTLGGLAERHLATHRDRVSQTSRAKD